ncbi:MAG: T9SS type A sorting domain-containing protein [Bacteroidales bacterium]|nr:T9SS type A sorting domain-containing protein [Bacteroidales bacterium]
MRKTLLITMLFFVISLGYSQLVQHDCDHLGCNHAKAAQYKQSGFTIAENPEWYNDYDVNFYFLDIQVENNSVYVEGNVSIQAKALKDNLSEIKFELLNDLSIESITVDEQSVIFTHTSDVITIETNPISIDSYFDVKIFYKGTPPTGGFFSGISTGSSQGFNITWTLSEPYAAKDWWPCKQDLTDKADSVYVFVTTDNINKVGSNGLLTNVVDLENNKVRYEWKSNYAIDYYLISLAIADYQEYNIYAHPEDMGEDSLLIQNYIYDSEAVLNSVKENINQTIPIMEYFSEVFGLYPFAEEKYGHTLTPLGGGMEHQTMTTMGGFSFHLIAHELGHQWWGDNVTCATWQDIWINEGFASYADYLAQNEILGSATGNSWMNSAHNFVMSQPGGSVFVPENELNDIWRIFDSRLSYNKGPAIIHMLRYELQDDDLFFNVIETFQNQFGKNVATGEDLKDVAEDLSGMDLNFFFDQWYYGEGYPSFDIEYWQGSDNKLWLKSTQSTSTSITNLFKTHIDFEFTFADNTTEIITLFQEENVQNWELELDKEVVSIEVDPNNWILNKVNSIVLDIDENTMDIGIYPNPTKGNLTIDLDKTTEINIELYDFKGKRLYSQHLTTDKYILDMNHLNNGIYLLKIESEKFTLNKKIIKN